MDKLVDEIILRSLFGLHNRGHNWSTVNLLLKDYIVLSGHNAGRVLVLDILGSYFVVYDGAHNNHTFLNLNFDEFNATLLELKK